MTDLASRDRVGALAALDPALQYLELLDAAWRVRGHGLRLDAVRAAAGALREAIAGGPRVVGVATAPIARFPYPTKYAFGGAAWNPSPLVTMTNRCLVVQFMQRGVLKTLLFNPTDVEGAKKAPFFAKLLERTPAMLQELVSPPYPSLESQLTDLGLSPDDIDYVAYDHFHTQDLRPILGTLDGAIAARFPRAKLLAPRSEWDDWARLHPMQRAWYVKDGRDGIDVRRVIFLDGDVRVGDGVFLVRTPGHTSGNQTLFLSTESGVWGCAENGTCADAYAPMDSNIVGLRRHARAYDIDLILNLNTPEYGADQYTWMTLERLVVDRVARAPAFVQMFPSSEVTASAIAPGIRPTFTFGALTAGKLVSARASTIAPREAVAVT